MYPKSFERCIEGFKKLPGVGQKSAERYTYSMLECDLSEIKEFAEALLYMKTNVKPCSICGHLTENDICEICLDPERDMTVICVVQSSKDLIAMEKTNEFKGYYHVLNGLISTNKGVFPEDLNIESLIERIDGNLKEIILATNATLEGETTALYLDKKLSTKGIDVTRIAHGIPIGGHLDYADELTLIKAIEGRKKIN